MFKIIIILLGCLMLPLTANAGSGECQCAGEESEATVIETGFNPSTGRLDLRIQWGCQLWSKPQTICELSRMVIGVCDTNYNPGVWYDISGTFYGCYWLCCNNYNGCSCLPAGPFNEHFCEDIDAYMNLRDTSRVIFKFNGSIIFDQTYIADFPNFNPIDHGDFKILDYLNEEANSNAIFDVDERIGLRIEAVWSQPDPPQYLDLDAISQATGNSVRVTLFLEEGDPLS